MPEGVFIDVVYNLGQSEGVLRGFPKLGIAEARAPWEQDIFTLKGCSRVVESDQKRSNRGR